LPRRRPSQLYGPAGLLSASGERLRGAIGLLRHMQVGAVHIERVKWSAIRGGM
jgi:hypothetical protein